MTNLSLVPSTVSPSLFPEVSKPSERCRFKTVAGSWKAQREALGITKDTPKAEVKAAQKEYMEQTVARRTEIRKLAGMLVSDDSFSRVDVQGWTDKNGHRHFQISGSNKEIKSPSKASATAKAVEIQQAADKALEAAAAKLVTAGKFATLEEAKAFLA